MYLNGELNPDNGQPLTDNNLSKVYAGEHMNRLHKSQSSYIYNTEMPFYYYNKINSLHKTKFLFCNCNMRAQPRLLVQVDKLVSYQCQSKIFFSKERQVITTLTSPTLNEYRYFIVSRSQPLLPTGREGLVNCKYSSRSENYRKSGSP